MKHHNLLEICNKPLKDFSTNKFLIAYSGGLDSSVLLHCFFTLSESLSIQIRSIHINHGLSDDADIHEEHCKKNSEKYGVKHISEKIIINSKSNIEEQCRIERYKKIADHCKDVEIIITAHHQEDQIETFFLRLIRGSGVRGLSCMKSMTLSNGKKLFRPFLQTSKDEINDYQSNYDIDYIRDETNYESKYDRNFIRNNMHITFSSNIDDLNKEVLFKYDAVIMYISASNDKPERVKALIESVEEAEDLFDMYLDESRKKYNSSFRKSHCCIWLEIQ